ncbi:MAG: DUF4258 domain-containing protein [Calditrichaceae bacterium]
MNISAIIRSIKSDKVRITDHADEEAYSDNLTFDEIFLSVINGELIEEYPKDKPYPSCLIFGKNFSDQPIHSVWAYNQENNWAVLITVYRPDSQKWIDWKTRRKKDDSF